MKKPYIICQMGSTIDGKIISANWGDSLLVRRCPAQPDAYLTLTEVTPLEGGILWLKYRI